MLGNFSCFFCLLIFSNISFLGNSFHNAIRVSNSLDPDRARHFVGPDLGPNGLQSRDTSRQIEIQIKPQILACLLC